MSIIQWRISLTVLALLSCRDAQRVPENGVASIEWGHAWQSGNSR